MKGRRWAHQLHRWVGILSCLFMLVVSGTALALNHADLWRAWFLNPAKIQNFHLSQARVLTADPHRTGHLLAADQKNLFESRDQGQTWQELKLFVPAEKVSGIGFSPEKADQIWVALREVGVYFSEDGGEIWEEVSDLPFNPLSGEKIETLLVGAGPSLQLQTDLAWYTQSPQGVWKRQALTSGQGRQALDIHDLIWRLHTGRFAGNAGLILYDGIALSLIFLSFSGLWLARRPKRKPTHKPTAPSLEYPSHEERLVQKDESLT